MRPGTIDDDLARRDFSINAVALSAAGELRAVPGALDDLAARRLRVLHDASFLDDPTRLWRLARYAARLGFVPEPRTAGWPPRPSRAVRRRRCAVTGSAPSCASRCRARPARRLHAALDLGIAPVRLDPELVADALALLPSAGARADLTLLGAVLPDPASAGAVRVHRRPSCASCNAA